MGALAGASLSLSAQQGLFAGGISGGIGAVVGAFAGYQARKQLVSGLKIKDALVALPEDLVAVMLAYLILSRQ
jgi:uncharacterized membrane protein